MNKKKCRKTLAFLILPILILLSPPGAPEAVAETRITITVAAGGAACGVFLFVHYAFRVSMSIERSETETTAIFNIGPEGWQTRLPRVIILESRHLNFTYPAHSPETIQMDILKWRF